MTDDNRQDRHYYQEYEENSVTLLLSKRANGLAITYERRNKITDELLASDLWYPLTLRKSETLWSRLIEYLQNSEEAEWTVP